ncbi:hypothetical protein L7F22_025824 [Adiantum nelumboides]|nr:hypothetical protein [Adiantum nelumboides]
MERFLGTTPHPYGSSDTLHTSRHDVHTVFIGFVLDSSFSPCTSSKDMLLGASLEVHGDTVFVTGIFTPFQAGESSGLWDEQGAIAATAEYLSSQQQSSSKGAKELAGNNSDFDLAVSLQNEEFESQQQQHHQQARIAPVSARQSQTVDSTMRADGSRLVTGPKKGNYSYKPETKSKCAIM